MKTRKWVKITAFIILVSIISLTFISSLFEMIIRNFNYSWYLDSSFAEFDPTYSELILSCLTYLFALLHYKEKFEQHMNRAACWLNLDGYSDIMHKLKHLHQI